MSNKNSFHNQMKRSPRRWRFVYVDYDGTETSLLALCDRSGNVRDVVFRGGEHNGERSRFHFEKYYGWSYKSL